MKIVLNSNYETLRNFIETLPKVFENIGTVIYSGRNELRRVEVGDAIFCVKRFHKPMFFNRIVYSFFRKSKAQRAYDNAISLLNAGIPTAIPVGYILESKKGLLSYSYLITEYYTDFHMMYEFAEHPMENFENVLSEFAYLTAKMHNAGFYHKDYSPGNILWKLIDDKPSFMLIDINRMDFGEVSFEKGCRNFKRLWGEPKVIRFIAKEYAKNRCFDEVDCEEKVIKYWRKFWRNRNPRFNIYD